MKDDTKRELNELMEDYGQKREETGKRAAEKVAEESKFEARFTVCRDRIILPVMREVGEHLRKGGHEYNVASTGEYEDLNGRTIPAEVRMEFYPAGVQRARFTNISNTPYVSFSAKRGRRKVLVCAGNMTPVSGGSAGPKGEFSLDEINHDFVGEQILAMVREVLSR